MPRLDVIPAPLHRCIYPGELSIEFTMVRVPEQGVPWYPIGAIINILHQNRQEQALDELAQTITGLTQLPPTAPTDHEVYRLHRGLYYPMDAVHEKPFGEIEHDDLILAHDEGRPYFVYLEGPDDMPENSLGSTYIAMCIESLASLMGDGLAYELGLHMISMLESAPPDTTIQPMYLRFQRMEEYNELYLNLSKLVAEENGESFERQAKLRGFSEYWTNTDPDAAVPRQLSWYSENGPSEPDETQADYNAEATDFAGLVQEGCLSAAVSLIFT